VQSPRSELLALEVQRGKEQAAIVRGGDGALAFARGGDGALDFARGGDGALAFAVCVLFIPQRPLCARKAGYCCTLEFHSAMPTPVTRTDASSKTEADNSGNADICGDSCLIMCCFSDVDDSLLDEVWISPVEYPPSDEVSRKSHLKVLEGINVKRFSSAKMGAL